jgi:hypothetical protein
MFGGCLVGLLNVCFARLNSWRFGLEVNVWLVVGRTVPLAHALGAHSVVAARDTTEESVQDLDESGPYQAYILQF